MTSDSGDPASARTSPDRTSPDRMSPARMSPDRMSPDRMSRRWWPKARQGIRAAASVAVAVTLLLYALPKLTGAQWADISAVLGRLTLGQVALLTLVWALGLLGYTWVLTGGLPGLTHAQALALNLSSSAVSNLVPFGGALGVAVSYAMARSWGFGAAAFALSTLVTGIWNVMAKLALPVLGLFALLIFGEVTDRRLAIGAGIAALALAGVVAAVIGALSSERVALVVGGLADRVTVLARHSSRWLRWPRRLVRRPVAAPHPSAGQQAGRWAGRRADVPAGLQADVLELRHRTVGLVRGRWPHLTFGIAAFLGAQALLQWLCLWMLGSGLNPVQVFAGFAFGRLLTSVVVTPGGVGVSETGAATLLVTLGGDPAVTASGVLLFSGYAFFLEIWAGGAGYAMWVLRRSWRRPPRVAEPGVEPGAEPGVEPGAEPRPADGRMGP
jgi:uncharacterized membrane protein YbhN (UPF0104 family)